MSRQARGTNRGNGRRPRSGLNLGVKAVDLVPFVFLILLLVAIFSLKPRLANLRFGALKADAGLILVLATIGQTFAILTGGIDLSIGGIIGLTNSLAATQMADEPLSVLMWVGIILLIGAGAGLINGCVIALVEVPPFIATLASWSIFNGLALLVLEDPGGTCPTCLKQVVQGDPLGFPNSAIIIALLGVAWVLFKRSPLGTRLYAVGSDENRSYLNGIDVVRTKIFAYVMSGLFGALAGLYRTVEVGLGSPVAGEPFILQSAAAALVGGVSLAGGRGDMLRSMVGAFVMLFIFDLIQFAGISSFYTPLVQGLFLIAAVTINAVGYRLQSRRALRR